MYVCACMRGSCARFFRSLAVPLLSVPFSSFYFLLFFRGVLSKTETQTNALFDESRRCVCVCVLIF